VLRRVEVVPHSRGWAAEFRAEADRLAAVLGEEVVAVHHVGSTAIPGISAKPIIDILLEVREVERLDDFHSEMAALGYEARGEFGIPEDGSSSNPRAPGVRTTSTPSLPAARAGAAPGLQGLHDLPPERGGSLRPVEGEPGEGVPTDIEGYMNGKDAFIKEMEEKALAWSRRRP
jgi:GrpB-like predicted nucleotidyltransferase (UPF0157 family)